MDDNLIKKFELIGLSESKAKETCKNLNLTNTLIEIINLSNVYLSNDQLMNEKNIGKLIYQLATLIKPQIRHHLNVIIKYICEKGINSEVKLKSSLDYLLSNPCKEVNDENINEFKSISGIGVELTNDDIDKVINETIVKNKNTLLEQRYKFNFGKLLGDIRVQLKFADGKYVKEKFDKEILNLLGEKNENDLKANKQKQCNKTSNKVSGDEKNKLNGNDSKSKLNDEQDGEMNIIDLMKKKTHFHKVGENYKTDGYVITENTMDLIAKHVKAVNGRVITRFPPEPNGILHIGHAKAINVNFGYAKAFDGTCLLRYDDTNPEKEEERFVKGIADMVSWLGYQPAKITYSSDYFDQLYEYAVELIKRGHAYVCHQKQEELKGFNPPPSPYRDRPVEENLELFEKMKKGEFKEGEAILRMKVTLEEGKQDPVAYRVRFVSHHRTGDKWCIYPTYDFTHCLCDSLENITHSLCTKEFQSRRSSYYWLCNSLDIYCPVQWEYARLNIYYTVVSKRKIARLINEKIVNDWDDPRLFTLTALRRRGVPAEAVNNFCAQMGLTGAQTTVDPAMLDAEVRNVLNLSAPRVMAVIEPLKIKIINFPGESKSLKLMVPNFPSEPERGSHEVDFNEIIYIEKSDFIEKPDDKGFRRLTKNQSVGLRHTGYVINVIDIIQDKTTNEIIEITVECKSVNDIKEKPKAFIHWVSSNSFDCEVRLYDRLFNKKNPEEDANLLSCLNDNSLQIIKDAKIERSVENAAIYDKYQFERLGFFSVDPDTVKNKLVFNRTVNLKDSK